MEEINVSKLFNTCSILESVQHMKITLVFNKLRQGTI